MAQPGKFKFMILSKTLVNHSTEILVLKIASSKSVNRLELTIDNELSFDIRIKDLCKVASAKLKGLGNIQSSLTILQARCFIIRLSCLSLTIVL